MVGATDSGIHADDISEIEPVLAFIPLSLLSALLERNSRSSLLCIFVFESDVLDESSRCAFVSSQHFFLGSSL